MGRALLSLNPHDYEYVASSRLEKPRLEKGTEWRRSPDLSGSSNWASALDGIDSVVHLAGRVHMPSGRNSVAYLSENCEGTLKLARDASAAGVRQLIFLSSAKVFGEESGAVPFTESSPTIPEDAYAASKLAAERALRRLGGRMQIAILRSPLVYGPEVKANFLALIRGIDSGVPLPLASIRNRRSLIGVDNLASAIIACLQSEKAAGCTYCVTDGAPVSTPELVRAIASGLGKPARLFGLAPEVLEICAAAIGRGRTATRLTRSLELDDIAIRSELGWRPVKTFEEGIREATSWYKRLKLRISSP